MSVTINDIIGCLDEIAPFAIAESWDNVGLLVGDRGREVSSVLVGLDPTNRLLDEAIAAGIDTVITHHPAIFKPIPSIDTSDPEGQFLEKALSNRISVLACHTNFDSASRGVNDALAELLGLQDSRPLIPSASHPSDGSGMGRIGLYPGKISRTDFIARLIEILDLPSVQVAGELPESISCVALCGGSGSDFAETAKSCGADVYLSSEIKHNVARWAEEANFCIIDGSHYATEKPAIKLLANKLKSHAHEKGWEIIIKETITESHPFSTVDTNSYS